METRETEPSETGDRRNGAKRDWKVGGGAGYDVGNDETISHQSTPRLIRYKSNCSCDNDAFIRRVSIDCSLPGHRSSAWPLGTMNEYTHDDPSSSYVVWHWPPLLDRSIFVAVHCSTVLTSMVRLVVDSIDGDTTQGVVICDASGTPTSNVLITWTFGKSGLSPPAVSVNKLRPGVPRPRLEHFKDKDTTPRSEK